MYAKEAMDLIEYIWLLGMKLYINHDTNLHAVHHGLYTHSKSSNDLYNKLYTRLTKTHNLA